jgi:hypothetical protein
MRDLELEWKGRTYAIPADRAFALAERIERIVTIQEIGDLVKRPSYTTFSKVYAEMLSFAGVKVTAQEIWSDTMSKVKAGSKSGEIVMMNAVTVLIEVLFDGAPANDPGEAGNGEAGEMAEASSDNSTPSQSAA